MNTAAIYRQYQTYVRSDKSELLRGDPARAHVFPKQGDGLVAFSITDAQVLTTSHTINSSGPGCQTTFRVNYS